MVLKNTFLRSILLVCMSFFCFLYFFGCGNKKEKYPSENNSYVICIDPGHQSIENEEKEPMAPNATEMKEKVTQGTKGTFSGVPEYEVNLEVSLILKEELEARGYTVIMTRETNDVNISNSERAMIANDANVDAFVRIHCNGADDSNASGILTICPTAENPYCKDVYEKSRMLSEQILESMVSKTHAKKRNVMETDSMSGINWSTVPVTIIEMGFMTNKKEDKKLANPRYQKRLALGIADGIDNYFEMN